jgi:hypothetical protein
MGLSDFVNYGTIAIWICSTVLFAARTFVRYRKGEQVTPDWLPKLLASNVILGLIIALGLVGSCAQAYLYHLKPKVQIVEKPIDRIVEKVVPQDCPKAIVSTPTTRKEKTAMQVAPPQSTLGASSVQQSNSGGINVQQATTGDSSPIINSPITVGDVPKRISAKDLVTITQYLEDAKAKTRIQITSAQNANSLPFARDVYKAFKDAHWTMEGDGVGEPVVLWGGKRFEGVTIKCKGEHIGPTETTTVHEGEPLFYIGNVLKKLQVPVEMDRDPDQKEGDLITLQFTGLPTN